MQIETRTYRADIRAQENSRTVVGYAALYDSDSEEFLGQFTERIAPGAFDMADMSDVRALFNHDPNLLLARTSSGTLRLVPDERGLRYEFELPDTSAGRDLAELLKRGDVSQSSFGFTIEEEDWEEQRGMKPRRIIKRVKRLYDVSPVTYPAYPDTEVALRSFNNWKQEKQPDAETQPAKDTPLRDAAEALLI